MLRVVQWGRGNDANHYTITTHDDSIAAIGAFLERQVQTPEIRRTLPVPTVTVGLGWPEWMAWDQRRRGGRLLRRRRRRDRHPSAPPRARHRASGSPTGRPGTAIAAAEGKVPRLATWVICSRSRVSGR